MKTPLYLAASEDGYNTAVILITHFASRTSADIDDVTPLMIAQRKQNYRMINLLADMVPSPTLSPAEVSPQPIYPNIRPKLSSSQSNGHILPTVQPKLKRKKPSQSSTISTSSNPGIIFTEIRDTKFNFVQTDPLRELPDWQMLPGNQQPGNGFVRSNFNGTFDASSSCGESQVSPSCPAFMLTPPRSWPTSSPESFGGEDVGA